MTDTMTFDEPVVISHAFTALMSAPAVPPVSPVLRRPHNSEKRGSFGTTSAV